jgi:hypothetical protein
MPLGEEPTSGLDDPRKVESTVIAKVDWEKGHRDVELPQDQRQAVEARFDGWNLQGSDVPEHLRWDADRLASVRRSLEPDRKWGKAVAEAVFRLRSGRKSSEKR